MKRTMISKRARAAAIVACALAACVSACAPSAPRAPTSETPPAATAAPASLPPIEGPIAPLPAEDQRLTVPGFGDARSWLNVDHPLDLAELRGRVVVVDFWTSCCINCMHTLPVLAKLERAFAQYPVVVVGIHSPKFDEEQDAERLIDVVRDNRIAHPVASDPDMKVWRAWGVEAWPTVVVLDVEGRGVWANAGEPDLDELSIAVRSALVEAESAGKLATSPLRGLRPEPDTDAPLRYPGKILPLKDGGLAIADTGHHRVVIADKDGAVTLVVGSGEAGFADGSSATAKLDRPQGMAEHDGALYVADTGNHAIRRVDRAARTVSTVAGNGALGDRLTEETPPSARAMTLRSPWDLLTIGDTIYVALAGSHQIAALQPKDGTMRLFAGSGREARIDGERFGAAFAQPSALAAPPDQKTLYVLDSETSSVRAIDIAGGSVRTVVGKDLFVFGDVDGDREKARLQHPVGLTFADGALFVADTYNSKIKRVDPASGETTTLLGGRDDRLLDEPGGVAARGADLWIADTNHNRVVRVAAKGPHTIEPLTLRGLP